MRLQVGLPFALLLVLVAAVYDLRTGHIPNPLTLGGVALGAALQVLAPALDLEGFDGGALAMAAARAALGILLCGLVPFLLFTRDAMGGGDVKLLAALGALLGPVTGLEVQLYAFIAMSLFAFGRLAYQGRLLVTLGRAVLRAIQPLLPSARRESVPTEALGTLKFAPAVLVAVAYVAAIRWGGA